MKKETLQERANIINNSIYYMYKYIDTNITLEELAKENGISKFHFHRIFKEETKENFSEYLSSIRLQKAANLLITNENSTISEILEACGYSSHSSFIKAFKKRFLYTPSQWKNKAYLDYSKNILKLDCIKKFNLKSEIKVNDEINCIYIRHKGYNKNLKDSWQRLRAYAYELNLHNFNEYGLLHDNPSITPLDHCKYVAAISTNKDIKNLKNTPILNIPKHLCAVFKYKGQYGEIIELVRYINQEWIKNKGYEITTLPIYVKYIKNHLANDCKEFEVEINLPIKVIYRF